MRGLIIIVFIIVTTSLYAHDDDCGLTLQVNNVTIPWSNQVESMSVTFTAKRVKKNDDCEKFHITGSKGNATSYNRYMKLNSSQIPYNIYTSSTYTSVLKDYPDISSSANTISSRFSDKELTKSFTIYIKRPVLIGGVSAAGLYTDLITLSIYEDEPETDGSNDDYESSATFQISTFIPNFVSLSLVPPGSPYDPNDTTENLNFGAMVTGDKRYADLRVSANTNYRVSLSSQNNGQMKHTNGESGVSYIFRVSGNQVNLSNSQTTPVQIATGSITPSEGTAYPLEVENGSIENKPEGNYSDVITVNVTATN